MPGVLPTYLTLFGGSYFSLTSGTANATVRVNSAGDAFEQVTIYTRAEADALVAGKANLSGGNSLSGDQSLASGSSFLAVNGGDWNGVAMTGTGLVGKNTSNATTWSIVSATGVITAVGTGLSAIPNAATTATSANTASAIVARDSNGDAGIRRLFGNGTEIRLETGSGTNALRCVTSTSWTDGASTMFFQIGAANGNGTVSSLNANKFPRLNWFATGTQFVDISHGDSQSILPAPTKNLETGKLAASGDAGSFGILGRSTTTGRLMSSFDAAWGTSTDASRKSRVVWNVYDTAAREAMRVETSGSASMLGFYGSAATAKQTVTGSRGANAALADLLTKLATLGLITDSTS